MRHGTRGDQVENGLKRQPGIKWQKKRPKNFSRFMRHGHQGCQVEKRRPGRKKEVRKKMAEKRPKKFSRFMRHFPTTVYHADYIVIVSLPILTTICFPYDKRYCTITESFSI